VVIVSFPSSKGRPSLVQVRSFPLEAEGASKQCANPLQKGVCFRGILLVRIFYQRLEHENKQRGQKTSLSAPVPTMITNQWNPLYKPLKRGLYQSAEIHLQLVRNQSSLKQHDLGLPGWNTCKRRPLSCLQQKL